jgi:hypothetical protein
MTDRHRLNPGPVQQIKPSLKGVSQLANQHFSIWLDATILLKMHLRTKVNYCSGARHKERGPEQSYMFW